MSEELKIIANKDGTFSEYDDTFDITIHCQSEEEQNEVLAKLNAPQLCGDCISREKALQIIRAWFDREATPSDLKNEIEQLPPVTSQQKIGRWIDEKDGYGTRCSECGKWYSHSILTKQEVLYCCSCGAKMQEVEE